MRDACQQLINSKFPDFQPRNDFEVVTLATRKYSGARADLAAWLDRELAIEVDDAGSVESVMDIARSFLRMSSEGVTGMKPRGPERNVFLRPIPNSAYSMWLFPGCVSAREYCLDCVDTVTGVPVNSPFKFDLLDIPDPSGPSYGFDRWIVSLEIAFGGRQDEIPPGQEKFLLRDGQTCLLRRPGHKDVRFTVPVRRQPQAAAASRAANDVDVLDLPASIEA